MTDARFESGPKVKRLNVLPANPDNEKAGRAVGLGRFPSWLHRSLPKGKGLAATDKVMREGQLHTVCEEAQCPNLLECWSKKTATYLIMGRECTRSCGFCDIAFSKNPHPLDPDEPRRVAESAHSLGLKHVVITMVARDDIPDQGASHIVAVINAIRDTNSEATIELLTSDFNGNEGALKTVVDARPEIFNHNLETVRELTPRVRHKATYDRSLHMLKRIKQMAPDRYVKSGIMVGLGESEEQVKRTLEDLAEIGCDVVTMGQYLQPNRHKLRVKAFVHPDQFEAYAAYGRSLGIKQMYCGPFVRSSYNAADVLKAIL